MTDDELIWRIARAKWSVAYDQERINETQKHNASVGLLDDIANILGIPAGKTRIDTAESAAELKRLAESQRELSRLSREAASRGIDVSKIRPRSSNGDLR